MAGKGTGWPGVTNSGVSPREDDGVDDVGGMSRRRERSPASSGGDPCTIEILCVRGIRQNSITRADPLLLVSDLTYARGRESDFILAMTPSVVIFSSPIDSSVLKESRGQRSSTTRYVGLESTYLEQAKPHRPEQISAPKQ